MECGQRRHRQARAVANDPLVGRMRGRVHDQELEVELPGLGVEHEVVAAFLEALRESKDNLPPGLTNEIAGLLSSGTLNATALVDLVSRLAGDNTA